MSNDKALALKQEGKVAKVRKFRWTPKTERCIELLVEGRKKVDIARELGCHRNAILLWMQHPEFAERFEERSRAHVAETRARRVLQVSRFTDEAAEVLEGAFDLAKTPITKTMDEKKVDEILWARGAARDWGKEFRSWREQERIEHGDDVRRSEIAFSGGVDVRASGKISLRAFLTAKVDDGAIDVEALPAGDAGTVVAGLLNQALAADPAVLDLIMEEDRAEEEARQNEENEKKRK